MGDGTEPTGAVDEEECAAMREALSLTIRGLKVIFRQRADPQHTAAYILDCDAVRRFDQ